MTEQPGGLTRGEQATLTRVTRLICERDDAQAEREELKRERADILAEVERLRAKLDEADTLIGKLAEHRNRAEAREAALRKAVAAAISEPCKTGVPAPTDEAGEHAVHCNGRVMTDDGPECDCDATPRTTDETCGRWGCVLPAGHNMGKVDIPENHTPAPLFFVDTVTGEPCPTEGNRLCTITDRNHLHRDGRVQNG